MEPHEKIVFIRCNSLFTNIPRELVIQEIENRGTDILKNTKLLLTQMIIAIDTEFNREGLVSTHPDSTHPLTSPGA